MLAVTAESSSKVSALICTSSSVNAVLSKVSPAGTLAPDALMVFVAHTSFASLTSSSDSSTGKRPMGRR